MAGDPDGGRALALTGPARELQIALEHLGRAVHAPVPEGAAAGERRQPAGCVAVDTAVPHETSRLASRAVSERLEPEVRERGEAVVDLRKIGLTGADPRMPPQTLRHLSTGSDDVV